MTAPIAPAHGRGAAALELLQTLYPPPLQVSMGQGTEEDRACFYAVPNLATARLIVPARSRRAAGRILRRHLTGSRVRTRAARLASGVAAGAGVLGRVPDATLHVTGPLDSVSIEDPLASVLGHDPVCIAMPVGPARANRKPVLQVTDESGHILAYAKVGHNDLTRQLVRREAEVLSRLARIAWTTIRPPTVVHLTEWQGLSLLVLEPLKVDAPRPRPAAARRRLLAVVDEVSRAIDVVAYPCGAHPLRTRLASSLPLCGTMAAPLMQALESLPDDVTIPTGAWHGDLNPGNLRLTREPCPVWDWERFGDDAPLGFDLLHHDLHRDITVAGKSPRAAAEELLDAAPALLSPWQTPTPAAVVGRMYLLTLALRYIRDGQATAGARVGRVDQWILPALRRPR